DRGSAPLRPGVCLGTRRASGLSTPSSAASFSSEDKVKETAMTVKTLQDLLDEGVDGRHILVRSDFNVPLNHAGEITDAGRITASLPTLQALVEGGAKVIVMAHLGRPKGEPNPKFSLSPVAEAL